MGSLIEFSPEFYAMVTSFWNVYQPMLLIWIVGVVAVIILAAFALGVFQMIRPFLP